MELLRTIFFPLISSIKWRAKPKHLIYFLEKQALLLVFFFNMYYLLENNINHVFGLYWPNSHEFEFYHFHSLF